MAKVRLTFHGDRERWLKVAEHLRSFDTNDQALNYIEHLIKNEPPPVYTTEEKIQRDKKIRALHFKLKDNTDKYKKLLDAYEKLSYLYDAALSFEDLKQPDSIKVKRNGSKSWAVPFVVWSDWHVGEVVTKDETNGLNEYNPKQARRRAEKMFANTVKLIEKEMQSSHITQLVVYLGGDFINGWIHDENKETNSMTPVEEVEFATELISLGIQTILDSFPGIKMTIVTNVGNHGRYTKKYRFSNEYHTSFETLLYSNIVRNFKELDFKIGKSTVTYLTVNKQICRFYHGHQVRYRNGVGGVTIPLNKKQAKWDETRKADFNFMGHYHTLSMPNRKTVLNGSLVGYNGMAQFAGFAYERPAQAFILLHEKYGWTAFHRILAV